VSPYASPCCWQPSAGTKALPLWPVMVQAHASVDALLLLPPVLEEGAVTGLGLLLPVVVAGLLAVVGAAGRATGAGAATGAGGLGVGAVYPAVRGSYWTPRACSSCRFEVQGVQHIASQQIRADVPAAAATVLRGAAASQWLTCTQQICSAADISCPATPAKRTAPPLPCSPLLSTPCSMVPPPLLPPVFPSACATLTSRLSPTQRR